MSTVDVIVPCYNYAHFLPECVESVLSQSHRDVRVLIINDASPDDTHEVAQGLASRDSRVHYLRHPVNRGHIATYNEGLAWATGEYTILLSADDLLTPGALSRAVQLMDAHPEVGMTHGKGFIVEPGQTVTKLNDVHSWETSVVSGPEFIRSFCEQGGNRVCTPTSVVRTAVQQRIGGYRATLPHSGDMEMWLRFGAHGAVGFIHVDQAYYRKHASNMHYDYLDVRNMEEQKQAFSSLFDSHGDLVPNVHELRDLAMLRLAEAAFWSAYNALNRQEIEVCKGLLEFATANDPGIKSWKSYRRMQWKLLLGSRGWSIIQTLLRSAPPRRMNDAPHSSHLESSATGG